MHLFPPSSYIHLQLARVGPQAERHKHPGRGRLPLRDPHQQGTKLSLEVEGILDNRSRRPQPAGIDPALVLRVRLAPGAHIEDDEWHRSEFTILGNEPDNVILLFANDAEVTAFRDRIAQYAVGVPDAKHKNPRYNWLAAITEVAEWGVADRRGRTLSAVDTAGQIVVDAELWYPGSRDKCEELVSGLRPVIGQINGQLLDAYMGTSLLIVRVQMPGAALDRLLELDPVYKVEAPPKPQFSPSSVRDISIASFPDVAAPASDASGVCIIDSGLAIGHPLIAPAVGETIAVPSSLGTSADVHGHGTMVAGIALYGDVEECVAARCFVPYLQVFSARVTNEAGNFDDTQLVETQMREAIDYFHRNYGCRVFNVSLGDRLRPFPGDRVSAWAATLDELARRLNVVIVVSAGNYFYVPKDTAPRETPLTEYPQYLFQSDARILSPAEAVNVLTVGALARNGAPLASERYSTDPSYQVLGHAFEPSPFTCSGPGVEEGIKPDLCDIGGASTIDLRTGYCRWDDPGVACVTLNRSFVQEGLFKFGSGTSLAAPRVAYSAARIIDQYPQASANLVRALLAASAVVPQQARDLLKDERRILQLCGYGRPDVDAALSSTDERVVLVAEEKIQADTFHIFEVPLPPEFLNTHGRRSISVTLAFDAPVRYTRLDYAGTKMQFRLLRGLSLDSVFQALSKKRPGDAELVGIPNWASCKMEPGIRMRSRGTLQRGIHSIQHNPDHGEPYYLVVECQRRWAGDEAYPQRYALAVALEHSRRGVQLYQAVSLRARAIEQERVRVRS